MTAPLSPSAIERIDQTCDRFEADWKAGRQPRVDDYLDGEAGPEREALRQELLRVDAHYRFRGRATPHANGPFIAGYEVLGELGRGGMGVVYKARQLRPNRLVALKMISAGVHAGPRELERFLREADAVAHLQHPNIVQVFEVGEQDGHPYFALEYVAGGSLDRYLAGTPQPPRAAAELAERLAHAIHHAHERGIIHRDLKPGNVLLAVQTRGRADAETRRESPDPVAASQCLPVSSSLFPKLTDFGLAKLMDAPTGQPTRSGDVLGTPSYMAPEQVGGADPISAATDVYGLGAILYELLTGRPPFRAETALETLLQVQTVEPVSPSRLQPKCPRELVTICLKCLNKQPGQRYASALELAEDLRRFLDGKPIRARPVGPLRQALKWTRRQPLVASLAALLTLAVILGVSTGSWFWWQAEQGLATTADALGKEREAKAAQVATLGRFQVALSYREWLANNVGRAAELLDACTDEQRDSWERRYLHRLLHSDLRSLAGHRNTVQSLAMHPSGRRLVSASHDGSVRLWNLETGRGRIIGGHPSLALAVACSPDRRWIASCGSPDGNIKLWDTETGAALPNLDYGGRGEYLLWALAFDPTSRYLAVGGPGRVKVWDLHNRTLVYNQVVTGDGVYQVAFSPPDGRYLATASPNVRIWDWGNKATRPEHDWPGHGARTHDLAFSRDGNLLASGGRDGLVRVHSLQTGREEFALDAHQLSVTSVCFSPDGERLASAGQEGDMHVWNVKERRRLHTLHGHSGAVWDLIYSTDGKQLISAGTDSMIRVWNAAASQEVVTLPFQLRGEIRALAYGPGRLLAWSDGLGGLGVWDTTLRKEVLRIDNPSPTGRGPITSFAFDPTGRLLAWRRWPGSATLWDLDKAAEVPVQVSERGKVLGLAFTVDGTQLLSAQVDDERLNLRDLRTGRELLTLAQPGNAVAQVAFSPDTRRLATMDNQRAVRVWDTQSGRLLFVREQQPNLGLLALSSNGRFLAAGGVSGRLRVWDVDENRETLSTTGHASNVYGLALSPDGRRLASAASDHAAKLWDAQTGHEVLTLRTQLNEHSRLAFSLDGTDIASVNMDNQIQIWSTRGAGSGLGK